MWNNLLKITVVSFLWKRYKRTVIALPLLLLFFWVVGLVHQDYLRYAELQGYDQWIGLSFILKWLLMLLAVAVFIYVHLKQDSEASVLDSAKANHFSADQPASAGRKTSTIDTAFDNIRRKEKLKSKADKVIEDK